jgi:hypothetical protein
VTSEWERAIKHPISWLTGAVVSVVAVSSAILGDPTGAIFGILAVFVQNASTIFTAGSIAGFTLAPAIPAIPADLVQGVAIVAGIVVVLKIADNLWDEMEERFK